MTNSFHKIHNSLAASLSFLRSQRKDVNNTEQGNWAFQVASTKCFASNTKKLVLQS